MKSAAYWIKKLNLKAHPEGGYYKRTYCSSFEASTIPPRKTASMIYYLLDKADRSQFHRLKSDEIWLHHAGSSIELYILPGNGEIQVKKLGADIEKGEHLQIVIPAHHWFAAKNTDTNTYSLISCVVTPSFDFDDFEMADQSELTKTFPHLESFLISFNSSK